jgi:dCMP deaminase
MSDIKDVSFILSSGKCVIIRYSKAIAYYKQACSIANNFSKDPSTKVGAIFLYPETLNILSVGYNGMPRGIDETKVERWKRPLKYKLIEHAERNAIYNAAMSGTGLKDSICVVSLFPCANCARGIIQSGCKLVISLALNESGDDRYNRWKDDWEASIMMLNEADIKILFLNRSDLD